MQLSNIPSSKLLPPSSFRASGMGGIWSDLMTTGLTAYGQKTNATIAESQAAQAQAQAAIAAANAASAQASKPSIFTLPVIAALGAGVVIMVLKRRR